MSGFRFVLLATLACAAACSSLGSARAADADSGPVERDLRMPRRWDLASTVPSAAPQSPQDPARHIDQIEPSRRRAVKETRDPWVVRVGVGFGELAYSAVGTRFQGNDSMTSAIVVFEPAASTPSGPGLRLEAIGTDRSLFEGETMNDGVTVVSATARADGYEAFPHFVLRPEVTGDFELAIRVGAFVDTLQLHQTNDVLRSWSSIGGRIELEPTWTLWQSGGSQLDLRGMIGGDVGGARFRENFVGGSDSDTELRLMGEVGLGLMWSTRSFVGEVGYRFRDVGYGGTHTELFGDPDHTSVRTNVLFLDVGVRF